MIILSTLKLFNFYNEANTDSMSAIEEALSFTDWGIPRLQCGCQGVQVVL